MIRECQTALLLSSNTYPECVQRNCTNGQGTDVQDHFTYVGEFRNGKPNGQGTLVSPNRAKYVGEFKNAKSNG